MQVVTVGQNEFTPRRTSVASNLMPPYRPLFVQTCTMRRSLSPYAYGYLRIIIVREGTGIVFGHFGEKPISPGAVLLLGSGVPCGVESEGQLTVNTIFVEPDLVLDQFYWQHSGVLNDRTEAQSLIEDVYVEPAQVLYIGRYRSKMLFPWMDEMVTLSSEENFHEHFPRLQILWFSVMEVLAPCIRLSPVGLTRLQRARSGTITGRRRKLVPLRREAVVVRDVLRREFSRQWTQDELANLVQLSPKQLTRVFTDAYGVTPKAYLVRLRVQEMARLLRETDVTVSSAGKQVGWRSRSRALEAFTAHMGVTPNAYRSVKASASELPGA